MYPVVEDKMSSFIKVYFRVAMIIGLGLAVFIPGILAGQSRLPEADSIQIYTLGNQAFSLRNANPDSALLLANQALEQSRKHQHLPSQVSLWRIKGLVFYGLEQFSEALQNFEVAYTLADSSGFRPEVVLNSIGNVYFTQQDYPRAIATYEQVYEIAEAKNNKQGQYDAINNIGSCYSNSGQADRAIEYYEKAMVIQQDLDLKDSELTTIHNLGYAYSRKNDLDKALEYYQKGQILAEELDDLKWQATFFEVIGITYMDKSFFVQSIDAYQNALKIRETLEDTRGVANDLYFMGSVYQKNEDYETGLIYLERASNIARKNGFERILANCLNLIGKHYLLTQQARKAIDFLHQSNRLYEKLLVEETIFPSLLNLGKCFEQLEQLDSAKFYLNQAYRKATVLKNTAIIASALTSMGNIAKKQNDLSLALRYYQSAVEAARKGGHRKLEADAALQLFLGLESQKRIVEAFPYLKRYNELRDSIFSEENTREITQMAAQYEFEKEKQDIVFQNEREKLALDNKIARQRNFQITMAIVFVVVLGLLFLFFRVQRLQRNAKLEQARLNAEINEQKLKFEQKEKERLQEMDTFKSQFFTNISHEFRTPLTIIAGMADQIEQKPDLWLHKGVGMIRQSANNLSQLVEQILELRQLETNTLNLNLVNGDIVPYLKYISSPYQNHLENKNLSFQFSATSSSILMDFDPEKLLRVVSNLLSNALKFTTEGGSVSINVSQQENQLSIKVEDTGIGIKPDQLQHVFDRFYQIKSSDDPNPSGNGIGLALSKELVELMGGEISVESEPSKGSTFSILLPITQNAKTGSEVWLPSEELLMSNMPLTSVANSFPHQELIESEKPQLLIVEDNPDMVQLLMAGLEDRYQIQIARDGQEGIEMALETVPDLIVSDVMMPRKDGLELCAVLKKEEQTSHIPIILLTAKADVESRLTGLDQGADAYIAKPFDARELDIRLEKLLALRKTLQQKYSSLEPIEHITTVEDAFIQKLRTTIEEKMSDENFSIPELCQSMIMSRTQLYRKVKSLTNRSIASYIRSVRLHKARELLTQSEFNVSQVAMEVGFNDRAYFSRAFVKEFGIAPKEVKVK